MNASARTDYPVCGALAPGRTCHLLLLLCLLLLLRAIVCTGPLTLAIAPQNSQGGSAGQSLPAKAAIRGTVQNEAGTVLAGVKITATDQPRNLSATAITNQDGAYSVESLPSGTYTVTAESTGFEKQFRSHVAFDGSRSIVVDFSLHRETAPGNGAKDGNGQTTRQSLGGFNYYDKPEYKAGSVDAASHPGGYSAAAEADSYALILAYVQGENDSAQQATPPGAREPPAPAETEENAEGWNENQFLSRGSDLLLHRQFAPATTTFERAVGRYPDSAKLETGLGVALYAQGQYDRAVKALIRATELMPSDPRPYLLLARAYNASPSENDEVIARLKHLVEIEPTNAQAHYYYGLSLWKGKRGSEADLSQVEGLLRNAVTLDPQFVDAHIELGALYAEQARYALAIDEYRASIRLKPDLARTHYRLAQVYLRTGDKAAAQAELDAYEKLRATQSDAHR